ncbi:MAG: acyl-CoA dehydratase activase [Clostridiales bacterium]|nr:acyl-CoA dehydratase activase [Clostridiales bacterium]
MSKQMSGLVADLINDTADGKRDRQAGNAADGRKRDAYLGIDVGSISTKGVILNDEKEILASAYIWTEGNPIGAVKQLAALLEQQFDKTTYHVVATGTTGSTRRLAGTITSATMVKNEITAHAVGTTSFYPETRTILEIGGQDSKIILVENGVAVDYAMNTLCAAGTGAFLSSQSRRLGLEVEEMGELALQSKHPTQIAARCTVFAESDLVHKIQMGHSKEDIVAGLCQAVVANYLNNVGKGKRIVSPVVFQGGVSKNIGVVAAFEKALGCKVRVDENGHLMGAIGAALLAKSGSVRREFDFSMENVEFKTREAQCGRCSNNCEIMCVYRDGTLIDGWGNRCEKGDVMHRKAE